MSKRVYVCIKSKEDESKWKQFLAFYFPNHYAKEMLNEDLVSSSTSSKRIGLDPNGYGWLSFLCKTYGGFKEVEDFKEFKTTDCYKQIIANGIKLDEGEPSVVNVHHFEISFDREGPHWVSISNIPKNMIDDFISYLYELDREIILDRYIPGGFAGVAIRPYLDKTDLAKKIIVDIKNRMDVNTVLNNIHFSLNDNNNPYNFHFVEDLYEYYLSKGLDKSTAKKACYENEYRLQVLKEDKEYQSILKWLENHWPFTSRWTFIYMFRSEFILFMRQAGYQVSVKGGWVLNDKQREIELGLIDKNGNLLG